MRPAPRRPLAGAAARSAAAACARKAANKPVNRKKTKPSPNKGKGPARKNTPSKSPPCKKPPTALQLAVMEAVKAGISPLKENLDRMEKKVSDLNNSVDDMYNQFDKEGQDEEKAVTSMAQLETALNKGIEKVIESVGNSPSKSTAATMRAKVNKSNAMPDLPLEEKIKISLANKAEMEKVRSVFEMSVNESAGGAKLTRQTYVDTLAAWELMISSAMSVLGIPETEAETYLLSKLLFPDGSDVKMRTVTSWFTSSVPHMMDRYRKVILKAYFSALGTQWRTLDSAVANSWLVRSGYRTTPHGKAAGKVGMEAFFKYTGFPERIVQARAVGQDGNVDCVLGQVSLTCAAVRWHLEVRTGVRAAGHQGTAQSFHDVWREETNNIDVSFPLHNRPHLGIRLIDGADVRRTHTFSEEIVADYVPPQAGGAPHQGGGNNDESGDALIGGDTAEAAASHDGEDAGDKVDDETAAVFADAAAAERAFDAAAEQEDSEKEILAPDWDDEDVEEEDRDIVLQYLADDQE